MKQLLERIKDLRAECCVTLALNTHRTRPQNEQDRIVLKNLIRAVTGRLASEVDKRLAADIVGKLEQLEGEIDHNHNLESLIVFANENLAEYVRLPIAVTERAVVDRTFATRDVVRAMHEADAYYVLVLSRDEARLIEAVGESVVAEHDESFPIKNETLHATDKREQTMRQGSDNLVEEFFNRIDKVLNQVQAQNRLPVLVCTEERNFQHYKKVADHPDSILGHLNQNRLDEEAHHIVADAWAIVRSWLAEKNEARAAELHRARKAGQLLTDVNEVWAAVNSGRGRTLFVQRGTFQPAQREGEKLVLLDSIVDGGPGIIDDVIDEMIEFNLEHGGDAVFLDGDQLADVGGLALITRY